MATTNFGRYVHRAPNGFHRAAEDGPYLIYGPQFGHAPAEDEGMKSGLVATLVFVALGFGAVAGFSLGYVARGPKKE